MLNLRTSYQIQSGTLTRLPHGTLDVYLRGPLSLKVLHGSDLVL